MAYFKICQHCGAHLDPGEVCDCRRSILERAKELIMKLTPEQLDYVIERWEKEEAAQSATNTPDGKAEQISKPVSISSITENQGGRQV